MLFRPWQPAFRLSCKHAQLNMRLVRISSLPLFITVSILISCSSSFPKILFLIYLVSLCFCPSPCLFLISKFKSTHSPVSTVLQLPPTLKKYKHSFPSITIPLSLSPPHSYPSHHPSIPLLTTTIIPLSPPPQYPSHNHTRTLTTTLVPPHHTATPPRPYPQPRPKPPPPITRTPTITTNYKTIITSRGRDGCPWQARVELISTVMKSAPAHHSKQ